MRNFKSYIRTLAVAAVVAAGFASCQDDVDDPSAKRRCRHCSPTPLLELKEKFWSDDTNLRRHHRRQGRPVAPVHHQRHRIPSDEEGNIFKSIVIQDKTAALAFSVDSPKPLPPATAADREVVMDVTGMEIGKYAGLQQIGRKSWYENGKSWQSILHGSRNILCPHRTQRLPESRRHRHARDKLIHRAFADARRTAHSPEPPRTLQERILQRRRSAQASVWHTKVNEEQRTPPSSTATAAHSPSAHRATPHSSTPHCR